MTKGNKTNKLDAWCRDFQAEVDAFSHVSGLKLGGLASKLGYAASSVVTKNLDPSNQPTEAFISRMAATFDGFSDCWGEYLALRDDVSTRKDEAEAINQAKPDTWEDLIQKKRSGISQKHKELMHLYDELEALVLKKGGENAAS